MKKSKIYTCLLLLSLAAAPVHAQTGCEVTDTLQPETTAEKARFFYLEGLCQKQKGQHDAAFVLFEQAHEMDPKLVGALYELSNYAHYLRNDSLALVRMQEAAAIDPDNYWLRQAVVSLLVGQKRTDEAVGELERMSKDYPQKSEVLMMLVDMYQSRQDYRSVVRTLDRVELLEGKSEQLSMEKFRNYVQMKDEKHAFAEMRDLAEEYPNDIRYQVIIGDLYLDNGQTAKAKKIYDDIWKKHPDNVNVMLSLANYYQKQNADSLYHQMLQQVLLSDQVNEDARLQLIQALVMDNLEQKGDTAQILPLFRHMLKRPQTDTRVAELCVRYMITRDLPKDLVKPVLHQMLGIDPEAEMARNQLLSYAVEEEDTSEVVRLCKTAVDYGSSDPVYYYYLGIGYVQQRRDKEALEAFRRGLPKVGDKGNLTLLTNLYALMGDVYHRLGDNAHAYEAYDSCLIYRPDDALVLNNYAYYLSVEKRDLKRAEEMSLRSLAKEGRNATYLDTYAWILFQQKRYAEARVYADSLMAVLGDSIDAGDANVVEHVGDIYARCGQTEQAIAYWQQALRLFRADSQPDSPDERTKAMDRIVQKIKKRKYVE